MSDLLSKASALREQGNAFYKSQQFDKALESYVKGCAALETNNGSSEQTQELRVLHSVLNGNASQALFQLGRYDDAFTRAKQALDSGVAKDPSKLRYRAASSLIYAKRYKECRELFPDVREAMSSLSELELKKQAFKVIPSPCRATPRVQFEYYWMGNEQSRSYLAPLTKKNRVKDHRICIVGSSGDARHVLATMRDFAVRKDVLLELQVIDWEVRTCARSLILFTLLTAFGKARMDKVAHSIQDEIFDLFWYVLVSLGIPRAHLPLLDSVMDSICEALEGKETSSGDSTGVTTAKYAVSSACRSLFLSKTCYVKSSNVPEVIAVLRSWKAQGGDPIAPMSRLIGLFDANQAKKYSEAITDSLGAPSLAQMALQNAVGMMQQMLLEVKSKAGFETLARFFPDPKLVAQGKEGIKYDETKGRFEIDWNRITTMDFQLHCRAQFIKWGQGKYKDELDAWAQSVQHSFSLLHQDFGRRLFKVQTKYAVSIPDSNSVSQTKIVKVPGTDFVDDASNTLDLVEWLESLKQVKEIDARFAPNPTASFSPQTNGSKLRELIDETTIRQSFVHVLQITADMDPMPAAPSPSPFGALMSKHLLPIDERPEPESLVRRLSRFCQPVADLLFAVSTGKSPAAKMRVSFHCENAYMFSADRQRKLDVAAEENKPSTAVPLYDVVRLSNIPDYLGLLNSLTGYLPLFKDRTARGPPHRSWYPGR